MSIVKRMGPRRFVGLSLFAACLFLVMLELLLIAIGGEYLISDLGKEYFHGEINIVACAGCSGITLLFNHFYLRW